jgi:hypothetical protein
MSKKKPKPQEIEPHKKFDPKVEEDLAWLYYQAIDMVDNFQELAERLKERLPGREFSLARTRIEEAEMWLLRGFETAGYDEVPMPEGVRGLYKEEDEEDEGDDDEGDEG